MDKKRRILYFILIAYTLLIFIPANIMLHFSGPAASVLSAATSIFKEKPPFEETLPQETRNKIKNIRDILLNTEYVLFVSQDEETRLLSYRSIKGDTTSFTFDDSVTFFCLSSKYKETSLLAKEGVSAENIYYYMMKSKDLSVDKKLDFIEKYGSNGGLLKIIEISEDAGTLVVIYYPECAY